MFREPTVLKSIGEPLYWGSGGLRAFRVANGFGRIVPVGRYTARVQDRPFGLNEVPVGRHHGSTTHDRGLTKRVETERNMTDQTKPLVPFQKVIGQFTYATSPNFCRSRTGSCLRFKAAFSSWFKRKEISFLTWRSGAVRRNPSTLS